MRSRSIDNILQGPVESESVAPSLTILGMKVHHVPPHGRRFLQADENAVPGSHVGRAQGDFFAAVAEGQTIVKARGNQASPIVIMNANEVQIEPTIDN